MFLVDPLLLFFQVPEILLFDEGLVDVDEMSFGRDFLHDFDLLDDFLFDGFPRMGDVDHSLFNRVEFHFDIVMRVL